MSRLQVSNSKRMDPTPAGVLDAAYASDWSTEEPGTPSRARSSNGTATAVADRDLRSPIPFRVLVVEDNPHYAGALRNNLEIEGFGVDVAPNATRGLHAIRTARPALVILDVMLPGRDGYELLRAVRDEGINVPIVLLTARRDEADKLRGFGLGADDFITKPVSILELLARVRAVLRRAHPGFDRVAAAIRFGDIEILPRARTVRRAGEVVDLRPKEYELLLALLRHQGRVVSRAELLRDVWGYQPDTVSRTVDTHMAGLRQHLETDPMNPRYLITVRSIGYMMRRGGEE